MTSNTNPPNGTCKPAQPRRMWINQPSTAQPYYRWHGANVLVVPERDGVCRAYFTSGDVVSMEVAALALSDGWRP